MPPELIGTISDSFLGDHLESFARRQLPDRTSDRRSSGDIPLAFLIARAKERGEVNPTAYETCLIARPGQLENKSIVLVIKISRRKAP
jgi:hypothetical protein